MPTRIALRSMALVSASVSSFWSWLGSLLIRVHGLSIQETGLYIALFAGIGGPRNLTRIVDAASRPARPRQGVGADRGGNRT